MVQVVTFNKTGPQFRSCDRTVAGVIEFNGVHRDNNACFWRGGSLQGQNMRGYLANRRGHGLLAALQMKMISGVPGADATGLTHLEPQWAVVVGGWTSTGFQRAENRIKSARFDLGDGKDPSSSPEHWKKRALRGDRLPLTVFSTDRPVKTVVRVFHSGRASRGRSSKCSDLCSKTRDGHNACLICSRSFAAKCAGGAGPAIQRLLTLKQTCDDKDGLGEGFSIRRQR